MVLNATCVLQAARDRSDQLQQQLAWRDTNLHAAKKQFLKLQKDLAGKCEEVTADKQERAALQKAHDASMKASTHCTPTYSIPTCCPPTSSPHPDPWLLWC